MTQFAEQINQLKRSLLDLNNQLELQRGDNAKLRGQNEQLARDVAEVQRKQTDLQQGVDDRIRKVEPQKVTLDDKEFQRRPGREAPVRRVARGRAQGRVRARGDVAGGAAAAL